VQIHGEGRRPVLEVGARSEQDVGRDFEDEVVEDAGGVALALVEGDFQSLALDDGEVGEGGLDIVDVEGGVDRVPADLRHLVLLQSGHNGFVRLLLQILFGRPDRKQFLDSEARGRRPEVAGALQVVRLPSMGCR